MLSASPSEFHAVETHWQTATDALSKAEAGVVEALEQFRRSGDASLVRPALAARQLAKERMRNLMHAIWANPV